MSEQLFDGYPDPEPVDPAALPKVSADRRRTLHARVMIDEGKRHPATGLPFASNGHACDDCAHKYRVGHNSRAYLKCDLRPDTRGPGTDIRAWWPACIKWEP